MLTKSKKLASSPDVEAPIGLRERGKLERRTRIKAAARAVFLEKGMEAATTREIAELAGVAQGTLFLYARDKRELLMMILNEDLTPLSEESFGLLDPERPLADQLPDFFMRRYEFWAGNAKLGQQVLQAAFDPPSSLGPEGIKFEAQLHEMRRRFVEIIEKRQALGHIAQEHDAELIARMVVDIYLFELGDWLRMEKPDVVFGMARFTALLKLALCGVDRS